MTLAPAPCFPGQAAAPPGPCDLTGMYVMHHAFRRDLGRLAAAARSTPVDDVRTWRALRTWWGNVAELLHEHHTKEDELLWPLLLERVTGADRAVLDAMTEEHDRIDPLLERVGAGLTGLAERSAGDTSAVREQTADALAELRTVLDEHLAHEEREAVRIVQEHLSAEEWQALEAGGLAAKPAPPLLFFLLPWIVDGLGDELDPFLRQAGPVVRVMLRASRGRYRRLADRAFGPGVVA
jgi:iron-sulfur cluster repair protein YtfE (RIC family)